MNWGPLGPESNVAREAHQLTAANPNKNRVFLLAVLVRNVAFPSQFTERKTESRLHGRPSHLSGQTRDCPGKSRGRFHLNGFRNRDLQAHFFASAAPTREEGRRRTAWVGYRLRLLRAHGIICKVKCLMSWLAE